MFYKIVEATIPEKLSSLVNNSIEAGFKPIGGICHGEGSYLYQAMVLHGTAHQHSVASDKEGQCSCRVRGSKDLCQYFENGICLHPCR